MTADRKPAVVLLSIDEIRALHRMLIERKFDGTEDEFFGSPFIAAVQHRLADALATAEPAKPWAAWTDAAGHSERIDKVRNHIAGLADSGQRRMPPHPANTSATSWPRCYQTTRFFTN